jgi:methionyl-tRNA formyltransferase
MKDVLLLADGAVGEACVNWLLANHLADVALVITTTDNAISAAARKAGVATAIFESSEQIVALVRELGLAPELGLLLWWPRIIKSPLIGLPKNGFINTHPSLLPYNRGKHYNFWAIVEQAPFGVTLHLVDEGVDTGPILAQTSLDHGWEDTGETLYLRARTAVIDLVKATYPALRKGSIAPRPQVASQGSFHWKSELEPASRIALDATTTARDLLNRLRARTFPGYPGCRFYEDGRTYEVTVSIKDVT